MKLCTKGTAVFAQRLRLSYSGISRRMKMNKTVKDTTAGKGGKQCGKVKQKRLLPLKQAAVSKEREERKHDGAILCRHFRLSAF